MKPHKHAELIKAWADGAEIEFRDSLAHEWTDVGDGSPEWNIHTDYRIKPEPQPDIVLFSIARPIREIGSTKHALVSDAFPVAAGCNLKLTYDAQTLALKHAEVV